MNVKLTQIARLNSPLDLTARPGEPNALYVAEKGGRVRVIRNGNVDPNPVFDLSGDVSTGAEQGLLGITFNATGSSLYAFTTDKGGDVRVYELPMGGGARREVLFVEHSGAANHNGGGLQFRDGNLYAAVGDGGGAGDPEGDAQNLNSRLGKILRINASTLQVAVHDYGLRNPFRFSFDRATGDLWIGDVGQNTWEEVSVDANGQGGRNFGWNRMEGNHSYNGGTPPPNHTPPVFEYSHQAGACVVTGGYVYRGSRIPALVGTYVFIDVCVGDLWGFANGARRNLGPKAQQVVSFGQDLAGELYAVSLNGPVYRIDPA